MNELFFDSYAIIELILENENYEKFGEGLITTSTLNLMEVYYFLLRQYNRQTADFWMKKLNFNLSNIIKLDIALKAGKFRFEYKKEKLSYIDCIGYILSKEMNMKFLTGDEKFKNKNNVEFVK
ncbi:PIN domain-containing protein [Candidatus Pacearchaeota archaeon]|nr:PIN domain-containing protein [Candidatus Pacearchaeota archaeon]